MAFRSVFQSAHTKPCCNFFHGERMPWNWFIFDPDNAGKFGTWTFDFSTVRLGKRDWPLAFLGWNSSFSGVPHCLTRYSSAKVSVSISILRRAIFAFEAEEDDGRKSCENIQTIFIEDICIPPLGLVAAATTRTKLKSSNLKRILFLKYTHSTFNTIQDDPFNSCFRMEKAP